MEIEGLQKDDGILIMNTVGQIVQKFNSPQINNKFNLRQLNSGIYFVQVFNNKGMHAVLKIIKIKTILLFRHGNL